MPSILCVGNFAIDQINKPKQQNITIAGGAGYRVCLGLALYGINGMILTLVGREPIWKSIFSTLSKNNMDLSNIRFRDSSIKFSTSFSEEDEIIGFETENDFLMQELAAIGIKFNYENYDLVHVCPFDAKNQIEIIEKVASSIPCVTSMIHYSSLDIKSRELYLENLSSLNLLFLNRAEAIFLVDKDKDWKYCGCALSDRVKDGVIITLGSEGSAAFRDGKLRFWCPPIQLQVANTLGAGDCFVGGALSGWILSKDLLLALRYGSLAASFFLTSNYSSSLINFLEFADQKQ